jgi:hypothetical protein
MITKPYVDYVLLLTCSKIRLNDNLESGWVCSVGGSRRNEIFQRARAQALATILRQDELAAYVCERTTEMGSPVKSGRAYSKPGV